MKTLFAWLLASAGVLVMSLPVLVVLHWIGLSWLWACLIVLFSPTLYILVGQAIVDRSKLLRD